MKDKVSNIAAFVESLVNNEFTVGQQAMVLVGEDAIGGDTNTGSCSYTNGACTNDANDSCRASNYNCTNIKTCMGINGTCSNGTNVTVGTLKCGEHNAQY